MSLDGGHGTKVGRRTAAFLYKLTQLQDILACGFPTGKCLVKKVTLVPSSINFRNSQNVTRGPKEESETMQLFRIAH